MKIIIATIKSWNIAYARTLQTQLEGEHEILVFESKEELKLDMVEKFNPDYIFFPHWSYIIKPEIFEHFPCIVFHMTDLPFGRGGSPLQNLIVRGIKQTKISAIRVTKTLDEGPVYMKQDLSLEGSAEEIYKRASKIIFEMMIPEFIEKEPEAVKQEGEVTVFQRRKPEQSELTTDMSMDKIYDYIRMLDAEGYPNAYLSFGNKRLTFTKAVQSDGKLTAQVEISEEA